MLLTDVVGDTGRKMPRRDQKPYGKSVYRAFVMVMQFGINMLVPICLMSALGVFLDRKLGTSYIMVILFFVGAAAGAQNVYRMAKSIFNEPDEGAADRNDVKDEAIKKD